MGSAFIALGQIARCGVCPRIVRIARSECSKPVDGESVGSSMVVSTET
jgi:hypothetical protein